MPLIRRILGLQSHTFFQSEVHFVSTERTALEKPAAKPAQFAAWIELYLGKERKKDANHRCAAAKTPAGAAPRWAATCDKPAGVANPASGAANFMR